MGGGSIWGRDPKMGAGYDKEDTAKVVAWLHEVGSGDIVKEHSIHHSSFSATVARLMKSGIPVPPYIRTWYDRKLGWRRGSDQ